MNVAYLHLYGERQREKEKRTSKIICLGLNGVCSSIIMASRNDLNLEQKIHLIKDKENGLTHRELKDKFQISVGAVSNILKRKHEYLDDYESNQNKKLKRKQKDDLGQSINNVVYQWFVAQRAKKIPVSGPVL